jgi:cell division protein FtsL
VTPPAAAQPARTRISGTTTAPPQRRVSGPAAGSAAARHAGAVVLPLPRRAAGAARRGVGGTVFPLLDRLIRGRLWIAVVAVALMGVVFTQVSLLELNAGISRSVLEAEALERRNSALREEVARLGSSDRVQAAASALGMRAPSAGGVRFLRPDADPARVARRLAAPDTSAWQAALAAEAAQAAPPGTDVSEQTPQAPDPSAPAEGEAAAQATAVATPAAAGTAP